MDHKIRKLMTIYSALDPQADVDQARSKAKTTEGA